MAAANRASQGPPEAHSDRTPNKRKMASETHHMDESLRRSKTTYRRLVLMAAANHASQ